jgi:hypothetical protein
MFYFYNEALSYELLHLELKSRLFLELGFQYVLNLELFLFGMKF